MENIEDVEKNYYVKNSELYAAYVQWYADIETALAKGEDEPEIPKALCDGIIKICTRMSFRGNFIGYSYRDAMISDGIFDCFRYAKKFKLKYKNVYGYFGRIAWRAFLRRIDTEKTEVYTRALILTKTPIDEFMSHLEFEDDNECISSFNEFLDNYNVVENNLPMAIKRRLKKKELEELKAEEESTQRQATILEQCFVDEE